MIPLMNRLPAQWSPRPQAVRLAGAYLGRPRDPDEEEQLQVVTGSPSGGGGGGAALGPVAGAPGPSGGPSGPMLGPVSVQGTPMPPSPPGGGFGFPGTFPTMGPANTVFGFGGGWGGFGWPYGYPYDWPYFYPPRRPSRVVCEWEETPPKDDTKLICTERPYPYPVAWGPPGWGW